MRPNEVESPWPAIPTGLQSCSPGLLRQRLPWEGPILFINPARVASNRAPEDATLAGLKIFVRLNQGSLQTRNPGLNDGIPSGFLKSEPAFFEALLAFIARIRKTSSPGVVRRWRGKCRSCKALRKKASAFHDRLRAGAPDKSAAEVGFHWCSGWERYRGNYSS